MRYTSPPRALAALLTVGLFVLSACAQTQPFGDAHSANNVVVGVTMDEWHMTPSVASVPAGKVSFVVVNKGTMDHEMVILKTDKTADKLIKAAATNKVDESASGENVGEVEVEMGSTEAATFNLVPGHYVFICNIPGHYGERMYADFNVTGTAPAAEKSPATQAPKASAATPGARKDITLIHGVRPTLTALLADAQKGDLPAARKDLAAYDTVWNGIEVYVNFRSTKLYGELETDIQARLTKLLDDPQSKQAVIVSTAQEMLAKWDETVKMVETSPAISPLFDDLADLRILRTNTLRNIAGLLKAGDITGAKAAFTEFMGKWPDIEDLVKSYSTDAYADTEAATAKANTAFQKSKPDAAELGPLVADTLARYNFGVGLVNAAARNANMSKTTFTADDVKLASQAGAIGVALRTSLTLWQSGKYTESGDQAKQASGALFTNVAAALKAHNDADATLKKALDAYATLAGQAGDKATVLTTQRAATDAAAIAQQVLVGQFWTDPKFKDALLKAK